MPNPSPPLTPTTDPAPPVPHPDEAVDLAEESVAGEEDPGASIDTTLTPQHPAAPAQRR